MKDFELTPESVMGFEIVLQLLETLKKMKELLENLIHLPAAVNYITKNYYAQHLENHGPVTYNTPVIDYSGVAHVSSPKVAQTQKERVATKEMMSRAARITLDGGYWKSQRSWSVVFLVYCIWGYKGSVNDFLAEVMNWPDGVVDRMICNRDAVVKLKNMYSFTNSIPEWRKRGVPEPYCILGEQLDKELDKLLSEGL